MATTTTTTTRRRRRRSRRRTRTITTWWLLRSLFYFRTPKPSNRPSSLPSRELLGVAEPLLEKKLHPTLIVFGSSVAGAVGPWKWQDDAILQVDSLVLWREYILPKWTRKKKTCCQLGRGEHFPQNGTSSMLILYFITHQDPTFNSRTRSGYMKALEDAQTLLKELAYPVDVDDPKAGCFFGVRGGVTQMVFGLEFFNKDFFYSHHCSLGLMEWDVSTQIFETFNFQKVPKKTVVFPLVGSSQRPLAKLSVGPSTPNSRAGPGA